MAEARQAMDGLQCSLPGSPIVATATTNGGRATDLAEVNIAAKAKTGRGLLDLPVEIQEKIITELMGDKTLHVDYLYKDDRTFAFLNITICQARLSKGHSCLSLPKNVEETDSSAEREHSEQVTESGDLGASSQVTSDTEDEHAASSSSTSIDDVHATNVSTEDEHAASSSSASADDAYATDISTTPVDSVQVSTSDQSSSNNYVPITVPDTWILGQCLVDCHPHGENRCTDHHEACRNGLIMRTYRWIPEVQHCDPAITTFPGLATVKEITHEYHTKHPNLFLDLSIMRTCKALYHQCFDILWKTNTFHFDDGLALIRFVQLTRPHQSAAIRKIHFNRIDVDHRICLEPENDPWLHALRPAIISQLPNLKTVTLCLSTYFAPNLSNPNQPIDITARFPYAPFLTLSQLSNLSKLTVNIHFNEVHPDYDVYGTNPYGCNWKGERMVQENTLLYVSIMHPFAYFTRQYRSALQAYMMALHHGGVNVQAAYVQFKNAKESVERLLGVGMSSG